MQLALVIPVDEKVGNFAAGVQVEILRRYGRNPGLEAVPHITLKLGFGAVDTEPFADYMDSLAQVIPSFDVGIRDFGIFEEGILFLNVEKSSTLEGLRRRILGDLEERFGIGREPIEDERFHYHVTLAHGFSKSEFDELRKSHVSREIQMSFEARHLDLLCHTGRQWVTLRRASLRGTPEILGPRHDPPGRN